MGKNKEENNRKSFNLEVNALVLLLGSFVLLLSAAPKWLGDEGVELAGPRFLVFFQPTLKITLT